jgi:large subunit ribosomal protein L24
MKNRIHIKKGDNVVVISGKDKGKKGKVLMVGATKRTVLVEGVNMVTKHTKARKAGETGGIVHQEAPIYACKVMHICEKCGKPTRIGYKVMADGTKSRVCKNCQEVLDN